MGASAFGGTQRFSLEFKWQCREKPECQRECPGSGQFGGESSIHRIRIKLWFLCEFLASLVDTLTRLQTLGLLSCRIGLTCATDLMRGKYAWTLFWGGRDVWGSGNGLGTMAVIGLTWLQAQLKSRIMNPIFKIAPLVASAGLAIAGDSWPMFRGPNASGVSTDAAPPVEIGPEAGVLWKAEVPNSPSSPTIWGDQIFLTTVTGKQLETRAYHRRTGALLWTRVAPAERFEEHHPTEGSPAASTPAADAEVVVSYFGSAGLFCYDHAGTELWHHDLPVARTYGGFGSGTSPLIAGDRVILNRDVMNGAALMALDRRTGNLMWETPRPDSPTSYSTAIVWDRDGAAEVIVAGSTALKAYDLSTGSERWVVRGIPASPCTTPVLGEGLLFFAGWSPGKADAPFPTWESRIADWDKDHDGAISAEEFTWGSGMFQSLDSDGDGKVKETEWNLILEYAKKGDNVLLAIKPGGSGDITETNVTWKANRGLPYVASPLYYDGRLYLIKDGGLISSFRAGTGEPVYEQERIPDAGGSYYASPIAAAGKIYVASLQGKLSVLDAKADHPVVLHQVSFGERITSTPAIVGDKLYLRTAGHLYTFGS